MVQKTISQGTLKTDSGINKEPILALKVLKEACWISKKFITSAVSIERKISIGILTSFRKLSSVKKTKYFRINLWNIGNLAMISKQQTSID